MGNGRRPICNEEAAGGTRSSLTGKPEPIAQREAPTGEGTHCIDDRMVAQAPSPVRSADESTGEAGCRTEEWTAAQAPSPVQEERPATTQFEKRRRKLPHWEEPGAIYFITVAVRDDAPTLLTDPTVAGVLVAALHHDDDRRYDLHAYVLMPDHIHIIMRPLRRGKGTVPLPEIMQSLKGATAHRINAALGRRGPFWRDESYDRLIRNAKEYAHKLSYMEANPVRAGLVERADEWPCAWPPLREDQTTAEER